MVGEDVPQLGGFPLVCYQLSYKIIIRTGILLYERMLNDALPMPLTQLLGHP